MPKYKISVTKNQKKYSIILNASSSVEAKNKIHKEGYSILSIEEINEDKIKWHKFIFEIIDKNWKTKKWKVVALDPLKVYIKLKDGLWYDIKKLYSQTDENKTEEEKQRNLREIQEQYLLYKKVNSKNKTKKETKQEEKQNKENLDNFYLKKELEETYKLIDFVLLKLKNILENASDTDVDPIKKIKLQNLYNSIVKLKKTTNIAKLKEIGELALKKVGEIELEIVEKNKTEKSRKFLSETNKLLKKIGSKEQFIEKDKDISYIFNTFLETIKYKFSHLKNKEKKQKKQKIDTNSSSYWKTKLLIEKYSKKQKELNKEIFKTIFKSYKKEEKEKLEDLKIKLKVVKQNLVILKAKQRGILFSYTKILKWYNIFIELLLALLKILNTYFISFIYIFSVIIILYFLWEKFNIIDFPLNMNGIFIFIYIILLSFFVFLSRWVISLSLNIAIYIFLIILWVVNF